ncbi:exodeoxyribonuclease VII small subunit [Chitinivorax sp. PXF-14]|uniref:exodeoxyribonuclease VII small subunit n=1 Tax=Chitinivorax sp. PXF-14 TaxID=3230488 RepID=UPI0034674FD5
MAKTAKVPAPESFETALAELEGLIAGMESGNLPLEAALNAYKRGAELLQYCQGKLVDARQQVEVLEQDGLKRFGNDEEDA